MIRAEYSLNNLTNNGGTIIIIDSDHSDQKDGAFTVVPDREVLVIGTGTFNDGSYDLSFTSTVVPEPSTLLLLGSSLAGLGGFAWRRQRRK